MLEANVAEPAAVAAVDSVEALFRLDPLSRFEVLIAGANFADYLRAEPISFDITDPIFGYGCQVRQCRAQASLPTGWCSRHAAERATALRDGIGEAALGDRHSRVPCSRRPEVPGGSGAGVPVLPRA